MSRDSCLATSRVKALCLLAQVWAVCGWKYAPSGDIVGDNGEDLEWPSEAVLQAQPVLPPTADSEGPGSDQVVGATKLGSPGVVRVMTLGDWGPTTWPQGWVEKCIKESGEWAEGEHGWVANSCGSSMHHLCDTLGEPWRKSNRERCVGNSTIWLREEHAQKNVAKQMMQMADDGPTPKFVLSVGDNFYWSGVTNVRSGEFIEKFEKVYRCPPLCVPFLTALGNHDYGGYRCDKMFGGVANTEAQIEYDKHPDWQHPQPREKGRWVMPARYYKKTFRFDEGVSIDVFVLDTNYADSGKNCGQKEPCAKAQECMRFFVDLQSEWERWLPTELAASTANWRIVIGHHPFTDIPSVTNGGKQDYGGQRFLEMLVKGGAALYVAGHVHQSRLDKVVIDGQEVHQIVTGAGGGYQNAGGSLDPNWAQFNVTTEWAYSEFEPVSYGFSSLHFTQESVEVSFVNDLGDIPKVYKINNPGAYRGSWQTSDWQEDCNNLCGFRKRTRTLQGCSSGFEPECDPFLKPPLSKKERCYADEASKLVAYCGDCTGSGACTQCLDSFTWKAATEKEAARCENVLPFATAKWSLTCNSREKFRCSSLSMDVVELLIEAEAQKLVHSGHSGVRVFLIDSRAVNASEEEMVLHVSLGFSYSKVLDSTGMQALAKHMADFDNSLTKKIPGALSARMEKSEAAPEGLMFYDVGLKPVPWRHAHRPTPLEIAAAITGGGALVVAVVVALVKCKPRRADPPAREVRVTAAVDARAAPEPSVQVELPTR
mmetsp:Transcript_89467/g.208350  ORF Transcript_89467/g.208350 Transcript_89467/m.208350 type:complete len:767 (+) Transcript_89467:62-2362(+)